MATWINQVAISLMLDRRASTLLRRQPLARTLELSMTTLKALLREQSMPIKYTCPKCLSGYRQRSANSKCPKCGYKMSQEENAQQAIIYLVVIAFCGVVWLAFQIATAK